MQLPVWVNSLPKSFHMGTKPKHNFIQTHPSGLIYLYPRLLANDCIFSKSLQKGWFRKCQSIPDGNHAQPLYMILTHQRSLLPQNIVQQSHFLKIFAKCRFRKSQNIPEGNHNTFQTRCKSPDLLSQGINEGYHQPKQKTNQFNSEQRNFIYLFRSESSFNACRIRQSTAVRRSSLQILGPPSSPLKNGHPNNRRDLCLGLDADCADLGATRVQSL